MVRGATLPARSGRKAEKLSRAERNEETRQRLFDAATKVVGQYGYAEASVARITELAGVAQGTFYNHFENRQELLDQLLPAIGIDMVHFIRDRAGPNMPAGERELAGFRAFFEFVHRVPEFQRILNEAEFFAPKGYQKHLDNVATAFIRIFKRARSEGDIVDYSDEEFEAIVHMFMGARGYLSRRYASGSDTASVPDDVITAYQKLITRGLFKPANRTEKS
jgi:AcrR family transcriptional regulator